jgi:hypothetical protein
MSLAENTIAPIPQGSSLFTRAHGGELGMHAHRPCDMPAGTSSLAPS